MAIARAQAPEIEVVSADSMQVYVGMDIGTAKPSRRERAEVPHHLLDLRGPGEEFSVAEFQRAATLALGDIFRRGRRAVVVGGTGLYVRALVDRLTLPGRWPDVKAELERVTDTAVLHDRLRAVDPVAAARMEIGNRRRIVRALEVTVGSGRPFSTFGPGLEAYPPTAFCIIGLRMPRPLLDVRIAERVSAMMRSGLLDEVRGLATAGEMSKTARQALGYRELLRHVEHGEPLADCVDEIVRRTRRFARRQEAWFRRDPRIHWIDIEPSDNPLAVGERVLRNWEQRCLPRTSTH